MAVRHDGGPSAAAAGLAAGSLFPQMHTAEHRCFGSSDPRGAPHSW